MSFRFKNQRTSSILRQIGEATLGWSEPPKRGQGKSLDKVLSEKPDLFAYIDATEQRIQRSSDKEQQKADYSGKKGQHTRKTQFDGRREIAQQGVFQRTYCC